MKSIMRGVVLAVAVGFLVLSTSASVFALGDDKFEKEVEVEKSASKLAREVRAGDYDIITTEELEKLIDSGKDILIIEILYAQRQFFREC